MDFSVALLYLKLFGVLLFIVNQAIDLYLCLKHFL